MSRGAEALISPVIGEIPGSPGGVRVLAESWRSVARTVNWSADLASGARSAVSSSQGQCADACRKATRSLVRDLEGTADRLLAGAGVLEAYADILGRAQADLEGLHARATSVMMGAMGNPVAVPGALEALAGIAREAASIRAEAALAAGRTATELMGIGSGTESETASQADQQAAGGKDPNPDSTNEKKPLSEWDIERIKKQADGGADWGPVDQFSIGDCYLLATLQAYSQTESGRQHLRDHVTWDEEKQAFMVTLYDNGKKVAIPVTDYYAQGHRENQDPQGSHGNPSIFSIYERAYGQHFDDRDLRDGGRSGQAMKTISDQKAEHLDTRGGSGWFGWPWWDDDQYTDAEWSQIEDAASQERPVTASTDEGGTISDSNVDADTNNDGKFDASDQGGDYTIIDNHVYTVESIDDKYVTLINPWANNDLSDGTKIPGGRIRITREEYAKYFNETDIAQEVP